MTEMTDIHPPESFWIESWAVWLAKIWPVALVFLLVLILLGLGLWFWRVWRKRSQKNQPVWERVQSLCRQARAQIQAQSVRAAYFSLFEGFRLLVTEGFDLDVMDLSESELLQNQSVFLLFSPNDKTALQTFLKQAEWAKFSGASAVAIPCEQDVMFIEHLCALTQQKVLSNKAAT